MSTSAEKYLDTTEVLELADKYNSWASEQAEAAYAKSSEHWVVKGPGGRLQKSARAAAKSVLARKPLRAFWLIGTNQESFLSLFTAPMGFEYPAVCLRSNYERPDEDDPDFQKLSKEERDGVLAEFDSLVDAPAYCGKMDDYEAIGTYLRDKVCDELGPVINDTFFDAYYEDEELLTATHQAVADYFTACARLAKTIGSDTAKTWLEILRLFDMPVKGYSPTDYPYVQSRAYLERVWELAVDAAEKLWVDNEFARLKEV